MTRAGAERRLAEIQSGRSPLFIQSATHLQDLQVRLKQTASWCAEHVSRDVVRAALRPVDIGPAPLPANRWDAVDQVILARQQAALRPASLSEPLPPGRLLVYFPDAELSDGAAELASDGFFDVHNAPPWGCWVGYFEDGASDPSYTSYLLAWVPGLLIPLAAAGIDVNPEACVMWLDDVSVALREVIPHAMAG